MQFIAPHKVIVHFDIEPGMKVAELHAGSGFFTPLIRDRVGAYGNIHNIYPEHGDIFSEDEIELPKDIDRVIAPHVLFLAPSKSSRKRILSHAYRILNSGGKFIVIESNDENPLVPQSHDTVALEETQLLAELEGFVTEKQFNAGDYHYGIVFKKI
jgi:ubiquinone/menaquinone biosynthesis C-methylase UbiE